jgi:hypothetical protein
MIKLPRLPDRTPVKLTITLTPDLKHALDEYALLYADTYMVDEPLAELIPHMLHSFVKSDRAFITAKKSGRKP